MISLEDLGKLEENFNVNVENGPRIGEYSIGGFEESVIEIASLLIMNKIDFDSRGGNIEIKGGELLGFVGLGLY